MNITESDITFFNRAIELAFDAESKGNLPIGAVITLNGKIIAEGQNAIWYPDYNPNRHAEIEALRSVPQELWNDAAQMTLYTTLEPCLMCMGGILLHRIGRVIFGSTDDYGGAFQVAGHMPMAFEERLSEAEWFGPAYPSGCDPLFNRIRKLVIKRRNLRPD